MNNIECAASSKNILDQIDFKFEARNPRFRNNIE